MKVRLSSAVITMIIVLLAGTSHTGIAYQAAGRNEIVPTASRVTTVGVPFVKKADYDSGWVFIAQDEIKTFQHNLGGNPDDYVVDLKGSSFISTINQMNSGGDSSQDPTTFQMYRNGILWQKLNNSSIQVIRQGDDFTAELVRVRIWVVPRNDYDSGWLAVEKKETLTFDHNLGGSPDDYVVDLQFKTSGNFGVHNHNYGMDTYYAKNGGEVFNEWGGSWHSLNNKSIKVYRGEHELFINSVRIRIWRAPKPHYDSGWRKINRNDLEIFNHNLGGPWKDYYVDLMFRHSGGYGTHNVNYGGDEVFLGGNHSTHGAFLDELDNSKCIVKRQADDSVVEEIRVRIWANPEPNYDSGWLSIAKKEIKIITHSLGGDSDLYFVDVQSKDTEPDVSGGRGINQINYGGDDFKIHDSGTIESHGIHWWRLTNEKIHVYRGTEDVHADKVRVRIWIPPAPSYDSTWRSINPDGTAIDFPHSIGGDSDDYVVDMQFNQVQGLAIDVHQKGYGWNYYRSDAATEIWTGAAWGNLDNVSLSVTRGTEDTEAEDVRMRIWINPKPDYDSQWTLLDTGAYKEFKHNLGGNPDDYVLDLQFMDDIFYDVNQMYYGGNLSYKMDGTPFSEGAFWYGLNHSNVKVERGENDSFADQVRVRMWVTGDTPTNFFYLPYTSR